MAIAAARNELVARLNTVLAQTETDFPRLELQLSGDVEAWLVNERALAAEDRLRNALAASRGADADAGRMLVGPHRSDLLATHLDHGYSIGMCSTGEQKAALVLLMLAYAELLAQARGQTPLLLFDEVTAHLDGAHRAAFFSRASWIWVSRRGWPARKSASFGSCAAARSS